MKTEKWTTSMRILMENSNDDDDEKNHSDKDQAFTELHRTEFTEEIKLQYFVATAAPTHNL